MTDQMLTEETQKLVEDLREKLYKGTVRFSYRKANGEVRYASGTTNLESLPEAARPKDLINGTSQSVTALRYFDLDKQEWRSLRKENVLSVISFVAK